jgi:hypothetical protein
MSLKLCSVTILIFSFLSFPIFSQDPSAFEVLLSEKNPDDTELSLDEIFIYLKASKGTDPLINFIPKGRSAHQLDTSFKHPRVIASFETTLGPVYLGYSDVANNLEIISYNKDGTFSFQQAKMPFKRSSVETVTDNKCSKCHQNNGPIFSRFPWSETRGETRSHIAMTEKIIPQGGIMRKIFEENSTGFLHFNWDSPVKKEDFVRLQDISAQVFDPVIRNSSRQLQTKEVCQKICSNSTGSNVECMKTILAMGLINIANQGASPILISKLDKKLDRDLSDWSDQETFAYPSSVISDRSVDYDPSTEKITYRNYISEKRKKDSLPPQEESKFEDTSGKSYEDVDPLYSEQLATGTIPEQLVAGPDDERFLMTKVTTARQKINGISKRNLPQYLSSHAGACLIQDAFGFSSKMYDEKRNRLNGILKKLHLRSEDDFWKLSQAITSKMGAAFTWPFDSEKLIAVIDSLLPEEVSCRSAIPDDGPLEDVMTLLSLHISPERYSVSEKFFESCLECHGQGKTSRITFNNGSLDYLKEYMLKQGQNRGSMFINYFNDTSESLEQSILFRHKDLSGKHTMFTKDNWPLFKKAANKALK